MFVRGKSTLARVTLLAGLFTASLAALPETSRILADDWPQWRGPQRDGVWREEGVMLQFPSETLPPKWTVPVGPGYSGPTVADGRVYVTDRLVEPKQIERVHCFDEQTGEAVWSYTYDCAYEGVDYDAGPRAGVTLADGRAFALGSMGDLHVFDAATGQLQWSRRLNEQFQIEMPIWGIAAGPLVYDDLVILHIGGKPEACVIALNVATGEEVWRALDARASYSAPIIVQQAGQDVLVVWNGDNIAGLDPRSGKVHWTSPMPPKNMVIGIATPVVDEGQVFVTSFYDGSKLIELAKDELTVREVWRRQGFDERHTDALHSIIATPIMMDGYIYGVDSYGELRCLNAANGDRVWEDLTATPKDRWSNIHMVRQADRVWMFNERGELIIGKLSPQGFEELSRAKVIEPTTPQLSRRGQGVCWAHPAFANRHLFVRNDNELRCVSLEAPAE
jgi:outer membrane protein assembly factor BamB